MNLLVPPCRITSKAMDLNYTGQVSLIDCARLSSFKNSLIRKDQQLLVLGEKKKSKHRSRMYKHQIKKMSASMLPYHIFWDICAQMMTYIKLAPPKCPQDIGSY